MDPKQQLMVTAVSLAKDKEGKVDMALAKEIVTFIMTDPATFDISEKK